MAVFCPKCGKRTYNEYTCDLCQYKIKPSNYTPNKSLNINNNMIVTVLIAVIAISSLILAVSKLTEDTPQEKALQAMYGTTDYEEIKKINNDIVKQGGKAIIKAEKQKLNMFENMLQNK